MKKYKIKQILEDGDTPSRGVFEASNEKDIITYLENNCLIAYGYIFKDRVILIPIKSGYLVHVNGNVEYIAEEEA